MALIILLWSLCLRTYSNEEILLYNKINQYRKANGLSELALCDSLSYIAELHAENIYQNHDYYNQQCGLHTWYPSSKYQWISGCYERYGTPSNPRIMWFKPKEILGMKAIGYEIAHIHEFKNEQCNSSCCLKNWEESDGHNKVLLQVGWKHSFKRMGVAIYKGIATVWFASE